MSGRREEGVDGTLYEDGRQVSPLVRQATSWPWAELRARLAHLQRFDWSAAAFTVTEDGWHPIGLEALGFVRDPVHLGTKTWTYHFDRSPPDPNG